MMNATQEQAEARTSVFWDIKTYPVPRGCDARVVGRCIKGYLRELGYCGPLTIFAVGLLTDGPDGVLRVVSSSGIALYHVPLGSIGILSVMNAWKQACPAPANMMLISTDESIIPRIRHSCGYNIFRLFPCESLWKRSLLQDSGEDKCSETPESSLWICSVCSDHVGQGYEKFSTHFSTFGHRLAAIRVLKEALGLTSVIWDMMGCPVPPDCDALRVRPCIEQYLKDFGYSGRLTITAVGCLTDVNQDVMRAVSSTGINLDHFPTKSQNLNIFTTSALLDPPPVNIMVICPYLEEVSAKVVGDLKSFGHNIIELFPYNFPYSESLWKTFLLEDSGTLEEEKEDKCSETGEHASWHCIEGHLVSGQGFDNLITHLSSPGHPKPWHDYSDPNINTVVFWDIKGCPVPHGYNGRLVGLSIKQYLKDLNVSGLCTINAIGLLTDFPPKVLQEVSSSGIILKHGPFESADIMHQWASLNPSPANMMVICPHSEILAKVVDDLENLGYNVFVPLEYDSSCSHSLWDEFLLNGSEKYPANLEEEDTSWVCTLCHDISGKGFENFMTHLSEKHGPKVFKQRWVARMDETGDVCTIKKIENQVDSETKVNESTAKKRKI